MSRWKTIVFSGILLYMVLMSIIGTGVATFAILEYLYTPSGNDPVQQMPSRVDLAPEVVPYTMFSPPMNTTITDVYMPASAEDESSATIVMNEHGFRYGPLTTIKPETVTRYFMLGGSVVFFGNTNETTISGYLEQDLRQSTGNKNIEVINAGGTGFISNQELVLLITKVIDFEPDTVIVFDGFNDFLMPTSYELPIGVPFKFDTLEVAWYESKSLLRNISMLPFRDHLLAGSHFMRRFSPHWSYVTYLNDEEETRISQATEPLTPQAMVVNLLDNWRKMARFLFAHRVGGLFILQPFNTNALPEAYGPQYDLVEEAIPHLNEEFSLAEPPIRFHTYRDVLQDRMDLFWDSIHTYDEGNRIYAELMKRDLQEAGL